MKTLKEIDEELMKLDEHMKMYHVGYYPVFYFTKNYGVNVNAALELYLSDFYEPYNSAVRVKVKESVQIGKRSIILSEPDRLMLSWYLLQRIAVTAITVTAHELQQPLCVNRDGNPVQCPAYRKVLERASHELGFSVCYNTNFLKSTYAYREIAQGKKTMNEMAELLGCSKSYLMTHILAPFQPVYDSRIIMDLAGIKEEKEVKFI